MRRLVFAVATTLTAVVGVTFLTTGPAAAHADNNQTVCATAKKTIETGAQGIVTDLRQASSQVAQGNEAAADATVKAAAPKFTALGTSLQQLANTASDSNLKNALIGLGAEFDKVGRSVTDVKSLQNIDESQIDAQGQRVASICGSTPGPSGSPPSSSPSTAATA